MIFAGTDGREPTDGVQWRVGAGQALGVDYPRRYGQVASVSIRTRARQLELRNVLRLPEATSVRRPLRNHLPRTQERCNP